jgi:hypothetical protein
MPMVITFNPAIAASYTDLTADNLSFQFKGTTTGHATQILDNANQEYSNGFSGYTR